MLLSQTPDKDFEDYFSLDSLSFLFTMMYDIILCDHFDEVDMRRDSLSYFRNHASLLSFHSALRNDYNQFFGACESKIDETMKRFQILNIYTFKQCKKDYVEAIEDVEVEEEEMNGCVFGSMASKN